MLESFCSFSLSKPLVLPLGERFLVLLKLLYISLLRPLDREVGRLVLLLKSKDTKLKVMPRFSNSASVNILCLSPPPPPLRKMGVLSLEINAGDSFAVRRSVRVGTDRLRARCRMGLDVRVSLLKNVGRADCRRCRSCFFGARSLRLLLGLSESRDILRSKLRTGFLLSMVRI